MNNSNQIKCGRKVFELKDGDTVMDNGACYQLITRKIGNRIDSHSPLVSKKEFNKFIKNKNVSIKENHKYSKGVTLYIFQSTGNDK